MVERPWSFYLLDTEGRNINKTTTSTKKTQENTVYLMVEVLLISAQNPII